jgi:acyl carrier protein
VTNREKYDQVFVECFMVERANLDDELVYQSVDAWDSVGHMAMIAALEDTFDIMMETDDIIDFGSYTKGVDLLAKYDVVM